MRSGLGYQDLAGSSVDSLQHGRHPYDRSFYGWLVWGDGVFGARMQTADATPGPTDSITTRVWNREHFEEDQIHSQVDDLGVARDPRLCAPRSYPSISIWAEPRVRPAGCAWVSGTAIRSFGARSHGVLVKLNNVEIGTGALAAEQFPRFLLFDFPFTNARPGLNTLNVSLLPDTTVLAGPNS